MIENQTNEVEMNNTVLSVKDSKSAIKNNKKSKVSIEEDNTSSKCDLNIDSLLKLIKSSDSWELDQIKKMLEDSYLPAIRRELLNNRVLEWHDDLIKKVFKSFSNSESEYLEVFESLTKLIDNKSLNEELKQRVNFILKTLYDKIVSKIENQLNEPEIKYIEMRQRLDKLLSLQNEEELCDKVNELRKKLLNLLIKKFNPCSENSVELLDEINVLSKDLFVAKKRSKTFTELFHTTRTVIMKNSDNNYKHLCNVLEKLKTLKQNDILEQQVVNTTSLVQTSSVDLMKETLIRIKEELMSSTENIIMFEGTNLEFIKGYDSGPTKYVRCVSIWNHCK